MPQSNSGAGEARFEAAGPMLGRGDAVARPAPQDYAVRGEAQAGLDLLRRAEQSSAVSRC